MLRSERLWLRALEAQDVPRLVEMFREEEAQRFYVHSAFPANLQNEKDWISGLYSDMRAPIRVYLGVEWAQTRDLIGLVSFKDIDWINRHARFGIMLAKEARGKGIALEAARRFFRYAFEDLGLHRIILRREVVNEGPAKLNARLGCYSEGVMKDHVYRDGKYWDMACEAVTRDTFYAALAEQKEGA